MTSSSHPTSSTVSSKKNGNKMGICGQAKNLKNTLFKSTQKNSGQQNGGAPPTTSLGLGGMALAILMIMAFICEATASPVLSPYSTSQLQLNRRDLTSFNEPYEERQLLVAESPRFLIGKRNAELINGLIGMDLNRLSAMGKRKRGNAELINGLIGMDLDRLSTMGRKRK